MGDGELEEHHVLALPLTEMVVEHWKVMDLLVDQALVVVCEVLVQRVGTQIVVHDGLAPQSVRRLLDVHRPFSRRTTSLAPRVKLTARSPRRTGFGTEYWHDAHH